MPEYSLLDLCTSNFQLLNSSASRGCFYSSKLASRNARMSRRMTSFIDSTRCQNWNFGLSSLRPSKLSTPSRYPLQSVSSNQRRWTSRVCTDCLLLPCALDVYCLCQQQTEMILQCQMYTTPRRHCYFACLNLQMTDVICPPL